MSLAKSPTSLTFKVERRTPELLTPAKPTPHEFKSLSDIDNLEYVKMQLYGLLIYNQNPSMNGIDPVSVIRKAISEALVHYYPFAGRLREGHSGKLIVECNGEGVLFIEADAGVSLHQFGYPLAPPFPCFDQLLFDVPGSSEILNSPLLLIQVTRLKCGGFIFGFRHNHHMGDAFGFVQFMSAIGEIARGATSLSVHPVWERHIINSCNPKLQASTPPPHFSSNMIEDYDLETDVCHRAFMFVPNDILALRRSLPSHLQTCSTFEIVSACIWKCRVAALKPHPNEEMCFIWVSNLRNKLNHLIPLGYYGNAMKLLISTSTAKEIIENPLSYSVQLVRKAQYIIDADNYDQSVTDLSFSARSYFMSDIRHAGLEKVDFGWGDVLYGGPEHNLSTLVYLMPFKTKNKENGMMFQVSLPTNAMARFEKELKSMLKHKPFISDDDNACKSKL